MRERRRGRNASRSHSLALVLLRFATAAMAGPPARTCTSAGAPPSANGSPAAGCAGSAAEAAPRAGRTHQLCLRSPAPPTGAACGSSLSSGVSRSAMAAAWRRRRARELLNHVFGNLVPCAVRQRLTQHATTHAPAPAPAPVLHGVLLGGGDMLVRRDALESGALSDARIISTFCSLQAPPPCKQHAARQGGVQQLSGEGDTRSDAPAAAVQHASPRRRTGVACSCRCRRAPRRRCDAAFQRV